MSQVAVREIVLRQQEMWGDQQGKSTVAHKKDHLENKVPGLLQFTKILPKTSDTV